MKMRLLAPVTVDFALVPAVERRDPETYAAFWDHAARLLRPSVAAAPTSAGRPGAPHLRAAQVTLDHASVPAPHEAAMAAGPGAASRLRSRYGSIAEDSLVRPLHLLTIRLDGLPQLGADGSTASAVVEEVSLRVHDHQLALLEVELGLDDWAAELATWSADELGRRLDQLQLEVVALGERLARELTAEYLDPLVGWLRWLDRDQVVVPPGPDLADGGSGRWGVASWVARTLIVEPDDEARRAELVAHWLKDAGTGPEVEREVAAAAAGELDCVMRWLNYYARVREGSVPVQETTAWRGLRYAQYHYAVLSAADQRLSALLASALAEGSSRGASRLRAELDEMARRARLALLEVSDAGQYLQREVKAHRDELLEFWETDEEIVGPLLTKLEVCQQTLDSAQQRSAARARYGTDGILLVLGLIAVFEITFSLVEFGRTMSSDPDLSGFDLGRSRLIDWIAGQPGDAVLVIAGVLCLVLVVPYAFFLKRQGS